MPVGGTLRIMKMDDLRRIDLRLLGCWLLAVMCQSCGKSDSSIEDASETPLTAIAPVPVSPTDTRPPAPVWQPLIPLSTPGWQQSTVPFCDSHQGSEDGSAVWADTRGVFSLVYAECPTTLSGGSCDQSAVGMELQFNDGTEWKPIYELTSGASWRISGFPPTGPVVIPGYSLNPHDPNYRQSITFLGDTTTESLNPGGVHLVTQSVTTADTRAFVMLAFFGVALNHGYALINETDLTTNALLEYQNGSWSKLSTLEFSASAVWSDGATIAVAGSNQSIALRAPGSTKFQRLDGVPVGDYGTVWGFSSNNIWAGNSAGQLVQYDGSAWQVVQTNANDSITRLWGANGALYYTTSSEFGRWNGTQLDVLVPASAGIRMRDLWGRSQNEVFLAVSDPTFAQYKCGDKFLVWFDGTSFHRF